MARGGQIIDASIVPVPTQRNSRDENADPTRTCAQSVETFCPDCRAYRAKASWWLGRSGLYRPGAASWRGAAGSQTLPV